MSKEEFMKIQTCVLKVNIHCDGCKHKVKKILQKIDGVFTTSIDAEQGKVTVSGNVDAKDLIKKLQKKGKHAELWGGQKANNNQGNQFNNMQVDKGKGGNNKAQKGGNNQPKGGGGGQPNPQQLQQQLKGLQDLQQLQQQIKGLQGLQQPQQIKGLQDLKLPPGAYMKIPLTEDQNQKNVKFSPEDEGFSDYDDDYDYEFDDYDDDEFDEPDHALNKKPIMANVPQGMPQNIMMMNGNHPQFMNAQKAAQIQNAAQNAKKGGNGAGAVPVQVNMGNEGKNGNGSKKGGGGGGNNGGNNQNQGGKNVKNGGGLPHDGKSGGGGGANNKNGNNGVGANGHNMSGNGGKKGNGGGGMGAMNDGFQNMDGPHGMPNVKIGQMHNLPMGHQIGNMSMGQMGNIPAVQGLPSTAMGGGAAAGGGAGYFQGAGPGLMPGNPYHQQQQQHQYMAAALMNQQRAMGNESFQPMMYARPPPAINYAPQYPYPYTYPYPHPYGHQDPPYGFFSDENTSGCNVM